MLVIWAICQSGSHTFLLREPKKLRLPAHCPLRSSSSTTELNVVVRMRSFTIPRTVLCFFMVWRIRTCDISRALCQWMTKKQQHFLQNNNWIFYYSHYWFKTTMQNKLIQHVYLLVELVFNWCSSSVWSFMVGQRSRLLFGDLISTVFGIPTVKTNLSFKSCSSFCNSTSSFFKSPKLDFSVEDPFPVTLRPPALLNSALTDAWVKSENVPL